VTRIARQLHRPIPGATQFLEEERPVGKKIDPQKYIFLWEVPGRKSTEVDAGFQTAKISGLSDRRWHRSVRGKEVGGVRVPGLRAFTHEKSIVG
jgi:hypothetical protein